MWNPDWLETAAPRACWHVYNWLMRLGWSHERAKDDASFAVQEAVRRALEKIPKAGLASSTPTWANDEVHFTNWLAKVARNYLINLGRRQKKHEVLLSGSDPLEQPTEYADLATDLNDCLNRLTSVQREIWWRRYVDNKSVTDIASLLSLSRRTAYRLREEARELLRDCMTSKGWTAADRHLRWQ